MKNLSEHEKAALVIGGGSLILSAAIVLLAFVMHGIGKIFL